MNVEGDNGPVELVEATGKGVKKSEFYEVFDCDAIAILRPKIPKGFNISWEALNDEAYTHLGKQYDSLAQLLDARKMNCTEYVWTCLKKIPEADIWFHGLKALIDHKGNLSPQMFYDCGSFEVVLEIKR
jgi:hypothetical protein